MATWDDIGAVVATLPEAEEGTAYGNRAWRVKKGMLVWERPLRKADLEALGDAAPSGDIVGLRTESEAEKHELIAAMPEVFFTTPHFDGHAAVLARLEPLPVPVLEQLVRDAWLRLAPKRAIRAWERAGGAQA